MSPFLISLTTAIAMGAACAVLSIFVVTRRWAFIGEGIAHAGFGGAGTAWMLSLAFPAAAWLADDRVVYGLATAFCLVVALLIAAATRRGRVAADTAIGIFLVASLAWGFVAYGIYGRVMNASPPAFGQYLGFEPMRALPVSHAVLAVVVCVAVISTVWLLGKELLFYCTDPAQAEVSGVRVGFIHYLLLLLLAITIIVSLRLMGSVLVIALLILPGATAMLIGRTMRGVWTTALVCGLTGAAAGPLAHSAWSFIPEGPVIVLVLFLEFLAALAVSRLKPKIVASW